MASMVDRKFPANELDEVAASPRPPSSCVDQEKGLGESESPNVDWQCSVWVAHNAARLKAGSKKAVIHGMFVG